MTAEGSGINVGVCASGGCVVVGVGVVAGVEGGLFFSQHSVRRAYLAFAAW